MVKKIFVFITILGLFFVGIPRFNVKAQEYSKTWLINETIEVDYTTLHTDINFVVASYVDDIFIGFSVGYTNADMFIKYWYGPSPTDYDEAYYYNEWVEEEYRTITFETAPTGDLLTWLQANAVNQTLSYEDGYNNAREEYGYLDGNTWLGYDDGFGLGYDEGLNDGEDLYWQDGYDVGFDEGEIRGYNRGLDETDATGFVALLGAVFSGLGGLLAIELLPGIYIGAIIAVPLVFGIIFFILGKKKD